RVRLVLHQPEQVGAGRRPRAADGVLAEPVELPHQRLTRHAQLMVQVRLGELVDHGRQVCQTAGPSTALCQHAYATQLSATTAATLGALASHAAPPPVRAEALIGGYTVAAAWAAAALFAGALLAALLIDGGRNERPQGQGRAGNGQRTPRRGGNRQTVRAPRR